MKIAIVGGGIIGLSAAWMLQQHGAECFVFDKHEIGREASWAAAGMLSPGGEIEQPSEHASWLIEARRGYPLFVAELERASGVHIDYRESGALDLAYGDNELDAIEKRIQVQAGMGISCEKISREHVLELCPAVRREGLLGGWWFPGDAVVNPRDVVAALRIACERAGVAIRENNYISSVSELSAYDRVVVAAGAWSAALGAELPIAEPVKGHLIAFKNLALPLGPILRHGSLYMLQRANGALVVGASVEHAGFDKHVDEAIASQLAQRAAFVVPQLEGRTPDEVWTGLRPGSERMHIERWSDRVCLAYGHYRNGILLAPWTAQRIADWLQPKRDNNS